MNPLIPQRVWGAQFPSLYVTGWAAPRDVADLFRLLSGFLKSTCLGFIDQKNPNLGCRPGWDKATPMVAQAFPWKSRRAQWGLPLGLNIKTTSPRTLALLGWKPLWIRQLVDGFCKPVKMIYLSTELGLYCSD